MSAFRYANKVFCISSCVILDHHGYTDQSLSTDQTEHHRLTNPIHDHLTLKMTPTQVVKTSKLPRRQ